jgi:hypothetical protein
VLVREYIDDYQDNVRIDGCEIFEPYLAKSIACQSYNHIDRENWLTLVPPREHYDVILMVDVLEHFIVGEAVKALQKALFYSPQVLVSTPIGYEQGEVNGNPYEAHRSEWTAEALRAAGFNFTDNSIDSRSVIGLVSR